MLERFTDKAKRVVELARGMAHHADVPVFGSDHVLLGLAHYHEPCVACAVLERLKVSLDLFVQQYGPMPSRLPDPGSRISGTFVDAASDESRKLGHDYVGTEHLLLAIAHSESSAAAYLENAEVDYDSLRETTIDLLQPRDE